MYIGLTRQTRIFLVSDSTFLRLTRVIYYDYPKNSLLTLLMNGRLYAAYETPSTLFLVTELATGGELVRSLGDKVD